MGFILHTLKIVTLSIEKGKPTVYEMHLSVLNIKILTMKLYYSSLIIKSTEAKVIVTL